MKKIYLSIIIMSMVFIGCNTSNTDNHAHDAEGGHSHGDEVEALSYTVWTDKSELFVEFKPLIVGEVSRFAAHFSNMNDFSAVTKGSVTVSLVDGKKGIKQTADSPSSPGIFKPSLKPTAAGIYKLIFDISTDEFTDQIIIDSIRVFDNIETAKNTLPQEEENSNEISFLKEQAWKMDFANAPVLLDTIYESIKVGGEILSAQGDERTISATANGIILFNSDGISIGKSVSKGSMMFTISGDDIAGDNIESTYKKAKASYEQAKSNFERKSTLYKSEAISKSEFEQAELAYKVAETEYQKVAENFTQNGKAILANTSGYIKKLQVSEGEFVTVGQPLAVITQNRRLTIKAYVNQSDYSLLSDQISANFKQGNVLYSLDELGGKLLSFGKSVSADAPKIPVMFELDNKGELLPGSYIDVWIKTRPIYNALVVPVEALLEEYGVYSVIVQTAGESFEKRQVTLGKSDGEKVQITSGIKEGERVVTTGAYQVKMASMSGQVPAHGHSH